MNYLQYAIAFILLVWFNNFQTYEAEPIRGGRVDREDEAIWLVSIEREARGEWEPICSGSLINPQYVVSAAHCFIEFTCEKDEPGSVTATGYRDVSKEAHRIVIGLKDLKQISGNRGIKKKLKRVFIPNDFRPSLSSYKRYSDIAVLRLDSPVDENDAIRYPNEKYGFINLPDEEDQNVDIDGREGFVAGFGATDARRCPDSNRIKYRYNGVKKILKVNFAVTNTCKIPTLKHVRHIGEASTAQGFAKGDSGGPLYVKDEINDWFKLVGVISRGPCDGDMRNKTGKVTFVPEYLKFLKTVTKLDKNRIYNEKSVEEYDKSRLEYFALPDHNKIARSKLFLDKRSGSCLIN